MNRGLGQVIILYVLYGLRSRNLTCVQVLYEESSFRVGPQGAVIEVARADGIYFNVGGYQLQGKALGQADAAELTACVSASCCAFIIAEAYLAALK